MTDIAAHATPAVPLRDRLSALAPRRTGWDILGFATGFRAWHIYSDLYDRSDEELRTLGVRRADLPRLAMDAARV